MFVRKKRVKSGGKEHEYLQVVENQRVDGKVKQRVVATLGRADELAKSGRLDSLAVSLGRFCDEAVVLNTYREGSVQAEWTRSWGPVLIFRRIWERLKLHNIINECIDGRKFEFDVEAAIFAVALQRLLMPGSDLQGSYWVNRMMFPRFWDLELHHLYRALDVLYEHRERIETRLFEARRAAFGADVDVVFFDTTTLYFEGEGPPSIARRGHSKDYRPQNTQVVVCVVMSKDGFPLTCETWPGNTADIKSVQHVLALLKKRFDIRKAILVCDRGMVSAANLRRIRRAGMHYIIGMRMRRFNEVRRDVLSRAGRYKKVAGNLRVKQVWVGKHRYVVCHNPEEADRDRLSREAMLEKLEAKMAAGQVKALIGNRGYRTYLRIDKDAVTLDRAKILEEGRFDGKFVIRTSTDMDAADIATTYKTLFQVEALNRTFKDVLDTRPMYHQKASRVQAHIFGSFLALTLATALRKMVEAKLERNDDLVEFIEWKRMIEDVKAVDAIKLQLNDKTYIVRTELQGLAGHTFAAAGVRPPPRVQPWTDRLDSGGDVVSNSATMVGNPHPA